MSKAQEILLRAHVWTVAFLVPLVVRFIPLRPLLRVMTPPRWFRPYRRLPAETIADAVNRRLQSPVNMRRRACLRKGITLFHFLRLAGEPAVMHFGVYPTAHEQARMHAHCWVTIDGQSISDPPDGPHAALLRHGQADPDGEGLS